MHEHALHPTELRLYTSETEILRFAQAEGYLQVGGNRAMLLVEEAHTPEQLDATRRLWAVVALIIFLLCFTPWPVANP